MRKTIALLLTAVLMLLIIGCADDTAPGNGAAGQGSAAGEPEKGSAENIVPRVQYIRTDGYCEEERYPQVVVVESASALEEYIEENHWIYAFGCRDAAVAEADGTFVQAVEAYDAAWFDQYTLVLVLVEEGSGSNRHEVQGITAEGNIIIKRIIPEVGTCDMALWHMLLELPKDSPVLEKELTVEFVYEEGWVPPPAVAAYASRHASVQVTLPGEGWEWEEIPDTGGDEPFGIRFWPVGDKAAAVELCCHPQMIGLCGTGLDTEKLVLDNGLEVFVHAYDKEPWFLVAFEKTAGCYYAERNTDSRAYDEEIMEILGSAVLGEDAAVYDKIVAIAARESGADYEYATARFDINTGFWTVYLGKINTAGGDTEVVINDIGGIESITYGE